MIDHFKPESIRGRAFYFGGVIGIASWIIGSPILGTLIGYESGAWYGQIFGAICLGLACDFLFLRESKNLRILFIVICAVIGFMATWYGGMTLFVLDILSARLGSSKSFNILGYVIAYGFLMLLFGGFVEALLLSPKNLSDAGNTSKLS
ncbi:MAG: hypothetical protein PHQ05_13500 [Sterolibacterium sp.]|nr:hypothetical protein [Sterolibacterium sp.]